MTYKQEPPYCIQVELSEGCNLYCDFCGLKGIRAKKNKNYKFMNKTTARNLATDIAMLGWNARIEFAMHGEPTMNPDHVELVRLFRSILPKNQLMMTSNGGGIIKDPVHHLIRLFDAGLNIFAFDAYDSVKIKDKIDRALDATVSLNPELLSFDVHYYPDEPLSPHSRYPKGTRMFIRIQDIASASSGVHATLNNHCGGGSPGLEEPMEARCAKVFRELSVRYNGNVSICCNDWRGIYKIGNVNTMDLLAIWHHERMDAARRALYHGSRKLLSPCNICDAKSYRVGLLPDKKGKVKIPFPRPKDLRLMKEATDGRPYAKANKQPWEVIARG